MRASASVALNLAESAAGRRTDKERIRFFTISMGSLRECQAILELENIQDPRLTDLSDQLGRVLFKLCRLDAKPRLEKLESDSPSAETSADMAEIARVSSLASGNAGT
jgi:hypothetical protein